MLLTNDRQIVFDLIEVFDILLRVIGILDLCEHLGYIFPLLIPI